MRTKGGPIMRRFSGKGGLIMRTKGGLIMRG